MWLSGFAAAAIGAVVSCYQVVGVHDGDTVKIRAEGRTVTIRCAGFDAPELAQSYGAEARAALVDLVAGGVDMDPGSPDRYGRVVAYLRTVDGRDVAREMVSSGSAWWYRQYARGRADLGAAESSARAERRGLWARPGAVPPWEFRKGTRKPSKVYW